MTTSNELLTTISIDNLSNVSGGTQSPCPPWANIPTGGGNYDMAIADGRGGGQRIGAGGSRDLLPSEVPQQFKEWRQTPGSTCTM